MNLTVIRAVMSAARSCAFVMLENALYIERELPHLALDESLRAHITRVASGLVGTKHDILSEVADLDGLLAGTAPAEEITRYVERIVRWLADDVGLLHELVLALESARERDPAVGAACVLVTESAANIVRAFHLTKLAACESGGPSTPGSR